MADVMGLCSEGIEGPVTCVCVYVCVDEGQFVPAAESDSIELLFF